MVLQQRGQLSWPCANQRIEVPGRQRSTGWRWRFLAGAAREGIRRGANRRSEATLRWSSTASPDQQPAKRLA